MAFLGSASLLLAQGSPVQRTAKLSLSEPTEVSGTILQPGTYTIKVHDFTDGKVQVQVTDQDDKKVFATVTAMRMRRNLDTNQQQAEQTEFTFTTANGHPALSTWFYPGDEWGEQFTSGKATWIAEARAETATQAQTETRTTEAPAPAAETYQPAPEPAVAAAPTPAALPATLPKTGSSLPLFGLIGLGAFGAAAALHVARRMA